jgi:CIC family chloride channel protein
MGEDRQKDSLSVLTFGYGFLQKILDGSLFAESTYAPIAIILLIVAVGKTLTTSLTIGSGGSAGVFGPSMVIGGCLGGFVGLTMHKLMPGVVYDTDVVIFSILGMAAFFAAAANTPVSTLLMVTEMCSSYILLLPSMWVCALSYVLSRRWSLYVEQVPSRLDSPAHRGDFIIDVLQGMTVQSAMRLANKDFVTVSIDTPLGDMSRLLTDTRQTSFPVLDHENKYYGVFSLNDIRQFLYDSPVADLAVAEDLAAVEPPLRMQMDLSAAISRFTDGPFAELPVVDESDPTKVVGLLRRQDLIATYSARLLEMRKGG